MIIHISQKSKNFSTVPFEQTPWDPKLSTGTARARARPPSFKFEGSGGARARYPSYIYGWGGVRSKENLNVQEPTHSHHPDVIEHTCRREVDQKRASPPREQQAILLDHKEKFFMSNPPESTFCVSSGVLHEHHPSTSWESAL